MSNRSVVPTICLSTISFGLFWLMFSFVINGFVGVVNSCIDLQLMTQVSVDHFVTMLTLWKFAPFAFLIGLFFFVVEVGRGSDIPSARVYAYEKLLLMGLTASLIMLMAYGLVCDTLDASIISANIQNNLSPTYDSSYARYMCIQAIYILSSMIGYISAVLFMVFPLTNQTDYLVWSDVTEIPGNKEDYVTQYQNQQF